MPENLEIRNIRPDLQHCDECGTEARLSFWRKLLQPPHMDAGEWHCMGLCEECSADGPDMEGFERYAFASANQ